MLDMDDLSWASEMRFSAGPSGCSARSHQARGCIGLRWWKCVLLDASKLSDYFLCDLVCLI